jgi:hypothetical protein
MNDNVIVHPALNKSAVVHPSTIPALQGECIALTGKGLDPQLVINVARAFSNLELLKSAFPRMPSHMRYELLSGARVLVCDQYGVWLTLTPSEEQGAV